MRNRKAQEILEYVLILSAIIGAIVMAKGVISNAVTTRMNKAAQVISGGNLSGLN